MKSYERIIFFLFLLSIPIQIGKHFWPEFSFVSGIRVDYLSPTLYLSDISFLLLFLISFWRLRRNLFQLVKQPLFIFTFVVLLVGTFLAISSQSVLYGLVKFLEFSYIAFYVSYSLQKKDFSLLSFAFTLGGLVETIIAFFQFYSQRSLGGPFYFLGERTFDASTPGIAAFRWSEHFLLRPYGTFSHPNVLAFYLLCAFTLLLFTQKIKNEVKLLALLALASGIFITFSRVVFLLLLAIILVWIVKYAKGMSKKTRVRIAFATLVSLSAIASIFVSRLQRDLLSDALLRWDLIVIGWQVLIKNILFGTGLNNFFYHEVFYQKQLTPTLLQPVHNIFIMWIVQTGIFGAISLLFFIKKIIFDMKGNIASTFLVCILIVGTFDHYLLTLQQGQLLFAFIIGLSFARIKA